MNILDYMVGKFFFRASEHGGFNILYRSFKHKVTLYHAWTSCEEGARDMILEYNSKILGKNDISAHGIEGRLEETARIIAKVRRPTKR